MVSYKSSSYKHRYLVGIFLLIAKIIISFANYHTKAKQNTSTEMALQELLQHLKKTLELFEFS